MSVGNISRSDQMRDMLTGVGFSGSSLEYLLNIVTQFAVPGIQDAKVASLMREGAAYCAFHSNKAEVPHDQHAV